MSISTMKFKFRGKEARDEFNVTDWKSVLLRRRLVAAAESSSSAATSGRQYQSRQQERDYQSSR